MSWRPLGRLPDARPQAVLLGRFLPWHNGGGLEPCVINVMDVAADPPSGTVTFLLTDVEGSTQAWEADAGAMDRALRAHDGIVAGVARASGGYVFSTAGDSFAMAFSYAGAALMAAV